MDETVIGADTEASKIKFKAPDMSKINLRKVNWLTILGILCYLHVLVLIPLIFGRKSPFVQSHVKAGMALLFVWVLFALSFHIPLFPWVFFVYLVVSIIRGITQVATGREGKLWLAGSKWKADIELIKKELSMEEINIETRKVNWVVALLMSIFFGQFGIDRFVMGDIVGGLAKLFLGIIAAFGGYYNLFHVLTTGEGNLFWPVALSLIFVIWWFTDIVRIASKSKFVGVEWV